MYVIIFFGDDNLHDHQWVNFLPLRLRESQWNVAIARESKHQACQVASLDAFFQKTSNFWNPKASNFLVEHPAKNEHKTSIFWK